LLSGFVLFTGLLLQVFAGASQDDRRLIQTIDILRKREQERRKGKIEEEGEEESAGEKEEKEEKEEEGETGREQEAKRNLLVGTL
jgi:hypothetical protein